MGGSRDNTNDTGSWTTAWNALQRRFGETGADLAARVTTGDRARPAEPTDGEGGAAKRHAGRTDIVLREEPSPSVFPRWRWD
ncbi:MAG: hypothetical protein ACR2OO_13545 [Thermomicrobiales bacterium]